MPRLFTALEIPAEIGQRLTRFRGGLPGARWVEPSDYHITLRFLGDIDATHANDVHDLLVEARPRSPIPITLDAIASFGGDAPRSVHAAIAPSDALSELQAEHERIARHAGLAPERRKFTPHVTLARLARGTPPESVAGYIAQMGAFERMRFVASRCVMLSARESRGGGPYVVEAAYTFGEG